MILLRPDNLNGGYIRSDLLKRSTVKKITELSLNLERALNFSSEFCVVSRNTPNQNPFASPQSQILGTIFLNKLRQRSKTLRISHTYDRIRQPVVSIGLLSTQLLSFQIALEAQILTSGSSTGSKSTLITFLSPIQSAIKY